jgi:hypothetical protein
MDVQNLDLITIQGIGQSVDELVGKYQFRTMPVPAGLKKDLVERLYTMGSKRHALSGIRRTLRPNQWETENRIAWNFPAVPKARRF